MREPDEGFWLDSDDDRLRRRLRTDRASGLSAPKPNTPPPKQAPKPLEISVRVSLPRIDLPKHVQRIKPVARTLSARVQRLAQTKPRSIPKGAWAVLALVAVASVAGGVLVSQRKETPVAVTTASTEVLGQQTVQQQPDFKTIQPDNKTATPVSYDADKKVASYTDTLENVSITVSQQPLPEGFLADPAGSVEGLAKQFSANEIITAGVHTAYLGTSAKGPQSVVMQRDGLLIFLYSNKEIPAEAWGKYIAALQIN